MATAPSVPVTGLSALGNVFADVGRNYARTKREEDLLARSRALQLEDRQAAEAREDTRYSRARGDQLKDVESARSREDEVYDRRRGDQLQDVEGARAYAESMAFLEDARKRKERLPFETNLQAAVDDAATQLTQVRARISDVARTVMSQPPAVSPNSPQVLALAQQLAGGSRNREEIALMVPKALEQVQTEALIKHANSVRAANEVLQTLRASEAQLTDIIQSGIQARVAPNTPPPAANILQSPTSAAPAPRAASAQDIAAAVNNLLGAGAAPAGSVPPPGAALLENPTNNPVIARGNEEIERQKNLQLQTTLNQAIEEARGIDNQLSSAANPMSFAPAGAVGGGIIPYRPPDPVVAAQQTSDLLKRKAATEARVRALQAQLIGPVAGPAASPAVNTPLSSTPTGATWWMNPQP